MITASTSIMLDTRRPLKDGTFRVKLRITFQRQRKYYGTQYSLSEEDFSKVQGDKPRGRYKEIQLSLQALEQNAVRILEKMPFFTFEAFDRKFLELHARKDVFAAYEQCIKQMSENGQAANANFFENAYISLISFMLKEPPINRRRLSIQKSKERKQDLIRRKKPLPFTDVTVDFLNSYEKWMLSRKKTLTTVSMYLRTLRTLFNDLIDAGDLSRDLYPFGRRKYRMPASKNVKKALTLSDVEKIYNYHPEHDSQAKARDFWIFSYLCNGINVKDIARLKYKQLSRESITFIRAKTERTTRHALKPIVAMRTPEINRIIKRWGNKPTSPDTYVFPILRQDITPEQELAYVRQTVKTINLYIKRVAAEVGIEHNVTTYTARHTFSTVLKRAGAPTEFISESLGHSNLKTTEFYLDSFEDDVKRQYAAHLTAFNKQKDKKRLEQKHIRRPRAQQKIKKDYPLYKENLSVPIDNSLLNHQSLTRSYTSSGISNASYVIFIPDKV
ncbi:site-specific integrase [Pontibacter sp. H249]|uniref:site-specific integrase n=1 Tax=Pontibacter sp. H249 TaxID=3133420 RepID=UPI0030C29713